MNFDEYQQEAATTAQYPGQGEFAGLAYAALGLNGEAGEAAEQVKKTWRNEGALTPERREKLLKEVGDTLWYAAAVCSEVGASLQEVAEGNLAKLADRRERGVIASDGDDR